jgi:PAS domain S-box-containing protein
VSAASDDGGTFRAFFDAAPLPFFLLDPDRRVRQANRAALRTFAAFGPDLSLRPFSSLLSGPSQQRLEEAFRSAAQDPGGSFSIAAESASAAGKGWPMEVTILRLREGERPPFGAVVRDLRAAPPRPGPPSEGEKGTYTLAELLMANRLRELV